MEQPVTQQNDESIPPAVTELPLSAWERSLAGFLVILAMSCAFLVIIAYWPDKLPAGQSGTYLKKAFHVQLLEAPRTVTAPNHTDAINQPPLDAAAKAKKDSLDKIAAKAKEVPVCPPDTKCYCTISLNSLLLILVAAAGFLGNMVHIANSLTAFIGAGTYRRSWAPWYFVKPFTAAGLAIFVYFMISGTGSENSPLNLKTILGTAALAGLFTDIATQKLREVLVALFKPTDNRPDKLMPAPAAATAKAMTIDSAGIKPDTLDSAKATTIIIPGTNLVKEKLLITMHGRPVNDAAVTSTSVTFDFTVTDQGKTAVELLITDTDSKKLGGKTWPATS